MSFIAVFLSLSGRRSIDRRAPVAHTKNGYMWAVHTQAVAQFSTRR
jgi:hypothetical protein